MKIINFPDPGLFKSCEDVLVFGPELSVLLESMWTVMKNSNGIGLAANQVGLTFNMFVMNGPKDEKLFIVNPKTIKQSFLPANLKEGCLSAPGEFLIVPDRLNWVEIEFKDEKGNIQKRVFEGIHSVCVQHEMEHLLGKSFMESKKIPKSMRKRLATKWRFKLK